MATNPSSAKRRAVLISALLGLALACLWPAAAASAQAHPPAAKSGASSNATQAAPPALPAQLTPEAIRELVARLPDDQVRALLIQQLDKSASVHTAANEQAPSGILMQIETAGGTLHERIAEVLAQAPHAPSMLDLVGERLDAAGGVGVAILGLALVLGAGFVARALWRRVIIKRQDRIAARNVAAGAYASLAIFGDAFIWLALELSGVAIFYVVAETLVFAFWHDVPDLRLFLNTYVTATTATLAVMAVTEFCLPRKWPVYRLLPLSDPATRRAHLFALALAVIWNFGFFTSELLAIYGAVPQMQLFLNVAVGTVFLLVLLAALWSVRAEVAKLIRGDAQPARAWTYLRGLLADNWHLLASAYLLLIWVMSVGRRLLSGAPMSGAKTGLISLLLLFAAPALDIMIGRLLTAKLGADSPVCAALRRTLRVVIAVGAAAIFVAIWGIDIDRLESVGIAGWLVAAAINVGIVALTGYAVWQLIRAVIDSRLEAERAETPAAAAALNDGEGAAAGATRAATLLPLFRSFAFATIAIIAVLTALSSLGVNIGPLLAGAGVVGIAIGFGAQTLVRDIVSGVFFLIDDAFRKGEYIDIGTAKGTVEKISIRSFQLRHHNGPLNTIPFGEIHRLTNYSRDWVTMKLPLRVTYDTDVDAMRKLIKKLGQELLDDPELGPKFLEPLKSQGVIEMDDSAMIVRVKFMTRPGDQFAVRNKVYARIRELFAREGIKFAHREVTVHVTGDADDKARREAAVAASRRILDDEERQNAKAPDLADSR